MAETEFIMKMANHVYGTGRVTSYYEGEYEGRDYLSLMVAVFNPRRMRKDGTPFTHSHSVFLSGPLASRFRERIRKGTFGEGMLVQFEGTYNPKKDKNGMQRYEIHAKNLQGMDAGYQNLIILQGRLAKEVEIKTTKDGQHEYCSFSVYNEYAEYAAKTGTAYKHAQFIDCMAWDRNASVLKGFKKGDLVWISGGLESSRYTAKDGTVRYPVFVAVDQIAFGGSGRYNQTGQDLDKKETDLAAEFMDIEEQELPY